MKRIFLYFFVFCLAYGVALVVYAPASLLVLVLEKGGQPSGPVAVHGYSGTIWSGAVDTVIWQGQPVGRLSWSLHPLGLLFGRAQGNVELVGDGGHLGGKVDVASRQQISVKELAGKWDAARLPGVEKYAPQGMVVVNAPVLQVADGRVQGNGAVEWRKAGLALSPVAPLGDYRLLLAGEKLEVRTMRGPLLVEAEGSLSDGRMRGRLRSEDAELEGILALAGRKAADGYREFAFQLPRGAFSFP